MVRTQIIVLENDLDLIDFTLFSLSVLFETIVCTLQPSSPPSNGKVGDPSGSIVSSFLACYLYLCPLPVDTGTGYVDLDVSIQQNNIHNTSISISKPNYLYSKQQHFAHLASHSNKSR